MDDIFERIGKLALIGGGKMGEAIVSGLINGALFDPDSLIVANPGEERRELLGASYGIRCVASGVEIVHPTTVILAVKPQLIREVCEALSAAPQFDPVRVVSIAAGITTQTLQAFFPAASIIRVMPNAPMMVGAGMSAVCIASGTPRSEGELGRELFALMGDAVLIDEELMNAATAISGSGPAYFALFVEEMTKAGEQLGLTPGDAALLANQTLLGTARYLELTGATPAELRCSVTSPKGTTQAALESFEAEGFSAVVAHAVRACFNRAKELA